MKSIRINGHQISGSLMIDDPDVRRALPDASGQIRHLRFISQPGRLRSYLNKHPEGMILAGIGTIFFLEPVPVSPAKVSFDADGNADILVRTGAIEKHLSAMDEIRNAAEDAVWGEL